MTVTLFQQSESESVIKLKVQGWKNFNPECTQENFSDLLLIAPCYAIPTTLLPACFYILTAFPSRMCYKNLTFPSSSTQYLYHLAPCGMVSF